MPAAVALLAAVGRCSGGLLDRQPALTSSGWGLARRQPRNFGGNKEEQGLARVTEAEKGRGTVELLHGWNRSKGVTRGKSTSKNNQAVTGNITNGAAISFLFLITWVHGQEVSAEIGGEEKHGRGTKLHEIEFVIS
jgi:hypothetical protein